MTYIYLVYIYRYSLWIYMIDHHDISSIYDIDIYVWYIIPSLDQVIPYGVNNQYRYMRIMYHMHMYVLCTRTNTYGYVP